MLTLLEAVLLVCLISMIVYWYLAPVKERERKNLKSG